MKTKTLRKLELTINEKLKKINPNYAIRNLTPTLDGKYIFDLKVAVNPKHFFEIRKVLKGVLTELPVEESVQAKFYLLSRSMPGFATRLRRRVSVNPPTLHSASSKDV